MPRAPDRPAGPPTWATMRRKRIDHVTRVAALVTAWAGAMRVADAERSRWLRAVWLHDAMRDAPLEELAAWAGGVAGPVELLHGPASAARALHEGERDQGILDAVRYHSVGYAGWDMAGRVLYCADFLEPGRDFDRRGRAALAARFPTDPRDVLYEVARRRLAYAVESGWVIAEATLAFWNSLASNPA